MTTLLPRELYGTKLKSTTDVVDAALTILKHELPAEMAQTEHEVVTLFDNAGQIRAYEDTAENHVALLIPLPYLHAADVTCRQLRASMATPCVNFSLEVDVAPSEND